MGFWWGLKIHLREFYGSRWRWRSMVEKDRLSLVEVEINGVGWVLWVWVAAVVSWAHRLWVDLDFLAIGGVWRWWIGGGFSWSIVVFGWVLMFGVWLVGFNRDVLVFWLTCCVLVFLWLLGFGLIWRLLCVLHVWLLRKCKKYNDPRKSASHICAIPQND